MKDPKEVGRQIRELLFSLRAENHTESAERRGCLNHTSDAMRREALEYAGICMAAPGEMAPACGCNWSVENPSGPHDRLKEILKTK